MAKFVVAVINGKSARFFTLDSAALSEDESSPKLVEGEGLADVTKRLHGQELWANLKTGRNRSSNAQAHSYDDHRQNHKHEFEKRFAQKISRRMLNLVQTEGAKHLLIVAEPQILGLMRATMTDNLFKTLNWKEIAKDINHFSINQIQDYLAKKRLLPACQPIYSR